MGKHNFCLVHITATEYLASGKVAVQYVSTHTNHIVNLGECRHYHYPNQWLTKRSMFVSGVTIDKVMDG